ncbi:hypothetical protein F4604DRAFT_1595052, partial [Suillus subluteus]
SLKWMHNQLFLRSRMLHQQHGVNSWNTFIQAKHKEANEGTNLEKGERIKLTQFIEDNKTELVHAHSKLMFAEKRAYNMQVLEACQQRNRITRANPKATIHDVNATFTSMDHKVITLIFIWLFLKLMSCADQHTAHHQRPLNKLISECRTFIQEGLDSIALENNIQHLITMNYTNYEQKMVEHRSFALVSWPVPGPVQNPSKVGEDPE